ncbi:MAG TPA: hypothetical protein VEX57_11325, partial [Microlunatus sp.]|nr:hypothetical protein [Microlunatus sp.]
LAGADHRIVGVVNDSVGSSKLDAFKKAFPDRLFNVGIAEQDMVGVAAGLANGGRIPFVSGAAPFRPGQPTFVIAHTHKGHPISFMSNNVAWHHKVPDADQLAQARDELEHLPRPLRTTP